jgi:hydrogenase maturation protein HypF
VVQGVGFRPFVYRLATELGLTGSVRNTAEGVALEIEGANDLLDHFFRRVRQEAPIHSLIRNIELSPVSIVGENGFRIVSSRAGEKTAWIPPDLATCGDCLREIFDPNDRRYRYPFANCTHCGPRFTIVERLPYDRSNTAMRKFTMCPQCSQEYHDPRDRRFHAEPIACPECGPQLSFWDRRGNTLAMRHDALLAAAIAVREGRVLALKGVGGFQLMVDARNDGAVRRLRERKVREEKPFALMYPSFNSVKRDCSVSELDERLLLSPQAPIVLLERRTDALASSIAPGSPYLGVMLPYSPLHHLLMRELGFPVVATSGNLSDEPICIDEYEALERLGNIADAFLVHDRPIVRHVDDSVVRSLLGREQVLRRARGYAPLPIHVNEELPRVLAVGGHLKNTVAIGFGHEVFISQHIGDLETQQAYDAFRQVAEDLQGLYEEEPQVVACDLHPEYLSTKAARERNAPVVEVQHHYAHVLSCMAENEVEAPILGVCWDGTGFGPDGTLWGGEFLLVDETGFNRVAHFRPFRLPGGEAAIREPRRCALGLLYDLYGEAAFDIEPYASLPAPLRQMLRKNINSPLTSGVGRLFDAVASLLGVRQRASFEGQAAMELEYAVKSGVEEFYPIHVDEIVNWRPMIQAMLEDKAPVGVRAARFHNTLVECLVQVAHRVAQPKVALTGGCFQNKYLTERAARRLQKEGFHPYWHRRVPPNDGGIALGQAVAAGRAFRSTVASKGLSESDPSAKRESKDGESKQRREREKRPHVFSDTR